MLNIIKLNAWSKSNKINNPQKFLKAGTRIVHLTKMVKSQFSHWYAWTCLPLFPPKRISNKDICHIHRIIISLVSVLRDVQHERHLFLEKLGGSALYKLHSSTPSHYKSVNLRYLFFSVFWRGLKSKGNKS